MITQKHGCDRCNHTFEWDEKYYIVKGWISHIRHVPIVGIGKAMDKRKRDRRNFELCESCWLKL